MQLLIENATKALYSLNFIFLGFCLVFLYLSFLLFSHFFKKNTVSGVINDFYILLMASVCFITFIATYLFSMQIYIMALVWLQSLLILAFLLFLRSAHPFHYVVICQELPRVPLILTLMAAISGCGFTLVAMVCETSLLVTAAHAQVLVQGIEGYLDIEQLAACAAVTGKEENDIINVTAPSPNEPQTSTRGVLSRVWEVGRKYADKKVDESIDQPMTESRKEFWKAAYRGMSLEHTPWVYPSNSVGVELGTAAVSAHPVEIVREGEKSKVAALCYDRTASAEMAGLLLAAPRILVEAAVNNLVPNQSGCILVEPIGKSMELRIITSPVESITLIKQPAQPLSPLSPLSPPDHDIQAVRLFR